MHLLPRETIRNRSDELLDLLGLADEEKKLTLEYSHGMKKKLALAAALLPNPDLLFLDEPFEGVDAVTSRVIRDLLAGFVARGSTVFLTSHVLEIVEKLCTHVGIIVKGQLVEQASMGEIRQGGHAGEPVPPGGRGGRGRRADAELAGGRVVNREHLRAFLWLRWRLRVNQFRKGGVVNAVLLSVLAVAAVVLVVGLFVGGLLGRALRHAAGVPRAATLDLGRDRRRLPVHLDDRPVDRAAADRGPRPRQVPAPAGVAGRGVPGQLPQLAVQP